MASQSEESGGPDKVAESKKESASVCQFYLQGLCRFGSQCWNIHSKLPPDPKDSSVKRYDTDVRPHSASAAENSKCKKSPVKEGAKGRSRKDKEDLKQDAGSKKKPSMKTAEDVISRILWDPELKSEEFAVGYLDRFLGVLEKPFSEFSWEEDFAALDTYEVLAVPQHRIQYFRYRDKVVWDKNHRLDDVFGSTGSGRTIIDVIDDERRERNGGRDEEKGDVKEEDAEEETKIGEAEPERCPHEDGKLLSHFSAQCGLQEDRETTPLSPKSTTPVPRSTEGDLSVMGSVESDHHEKLKPNYFVSVRLTEDMFRSATREVHNYLVQKDATLADYCLPLGTLHLTLCLLSLNSPEEVDLARNVLQEFAFERRRLLPPPLVLSFPDGLKDFKARVLYVQPEPLDSVQKLAKTLAAAFKEKGLSVVCGQQEANLHVALAKVSKCLKNEDSGASGCFPQSLYKGVPPLDFGCQAVEELALCCAGRARRHDGFYATPAVVRLY
ncbi:leukocyte receptor cluster member 9 [Erpetoichthys calabaricus]|uniref:C3H1-type domain-containing protein n=1 Tax=Erpetoichthys calabaricus TaxID=27687 RepID=A0A8C4TPY4_ERPCA|nr:leukocyte receptor cluster member 9 [Erpetoichthys calabaricus]